MPTQLEWLMHDVAMVHQRVVDDQSLLTTAAGVADEHQANYPMFAADLLYRALDVAAGLGAALQNHLRIAALTLSRSLLETSSNLRYLVQTPDPVFAASVLRAYSLLQWLELDADDDTARTEWNGILSRMPPDPVAEARRRIVGPHGWTGRPARQVLEAVGFQPYSVYAFLARESHGGVVGHHARLERTTGDDGLMRLGSPLTELDVESTASRARSFLLAAYMAFHSAIGGTPTTLRTEDPETWRASNGSSSAA